VPAKNVAPPIVADSETADGSKAAVLAATAARKAAAQDDGTCPICAERLPYDRKDVIFHA